MAIPIRHKLNDRRGKYTIHDVQARKKSLSTLKEAVKAGITVMRAASGNLEAAADLVTTDQGKTAWRMWSDAVSAKAYASVGKFDKCPKNMAAPRKIRQSNSRTA